MPRRLSPFVTQEYYHIFSRSHHRQPILTRKKDLRTFDIGIMPMPDNKCTRGKCGFKAILYMSMAIPCVCSAVGVNKEIITDGVNGYLADTDDEWAEKLSLLISSPELRKRIGVEGRRIVEEKYSLRVNAPKFLDILFRD